MKSPSPASSWVPRPGDDPPGDAAMDLPGDAADATGEEAMKPRWATRGVCATGREGVIGARPGVRTDPTDLPPGEATGRPAGEAAACGDDAVGEASGEADRGVRAKIGDCDATDPGEPTGRRGPGVPGGTGLAGAAPVGGERGGLAPGPDIVRNQMRNQTNSVLKIGRAHV